MSRTLDERAAEAADCVSWCPRYCDGRATHFDHCPSIVIPELQAEIAALKAQLAAAREDREAADAPCDQCEGGLFALDGVLEVCQVCVPERAVEVLKASKDALAQATAERDRLATRVEELHAYASDTVVELKRIETERDSAFVRLDIARKQIDKLAADWAGTLGRDAQRGPSSPD